jgi:ABC-type glycerol-3-phosphate transport system substrate-binding protein
LDSAVNFRRGHPHLSLVRQSKVIRILVLLLMAMTVNACRQPIREPVTLSYFRLGWSQPDELPQAEPLSQRFTRETGIRLRNLPVPENTLDQLDLSRKLLEGEGPGPDVVNVDMIWAGVLEKDLVDLRPSSAAEIASINPLLASNYLVDGKLVAIPFQVQVGALEYRSDLLREYGYAHPPRTWDELEGMAERIQRGERAKGKKDFWGYVWQGADAEALTCNALEWQAAEGGGKIIEDDRTISVNNPAAIRSCEDRTISRSSLARLAGSGQDREYEHTGRPGRVGRHFGRLGPGRLPAFASPSGSDQAGPVPDRRATTVRRGRGPRYSS